ncbi:MAG: ABC transporter substrate-binding protein [Alphaproteobacteria bacterium]
MDERKPEGAIDRRQFLRMSATAAGAAAIAMPDWGNIAVAATGHLKAGLIGFSVVNTLDPQVASLNSDFWAITGMYNALFKFNGATGKLEPDLCESFNVENNNTTLTFKLRRGVKFHNGDEMTATDVKFSIDRVRGDDSKSMNKGKFAVVASTEAVDKYTFKLVLKEPFVPILMFLHNGITGSQVISKRAFEQMGAEQFGKTPVGTGPFRIKEWRVGERIIMEAHKDYFIKGEPKSALCDIVLISDEPAGGQALLAGDIHIASTVPFADAANLEKNAAVKLSRVPGANCRWVALNNQKAPFDDVFFRRAISMASNREAVVKAAIFGEGSPMWGITPPMFKEAYSTTPRDVCVFNPERARAEMAKGKYKAGTEAVFQTWPGAWWKRWMEIFVANANQVLGTKFTLEVAEQNTVVNNYRAGNFQGLVWGWIGRVELDEYVGECFQTGHSRNLNKYSNPKVDEFIAAGRKEFDPVKRGALYRQAEDIVVEEAVNVFYLNNNAHSMWRTGVQGWVPTPGQHLASHLGSVAIPS